jgi:hypothetical protein
MQSSPAHDTEIGSTLITTADPKKEGRTKSTT